MPAPDASSPAGDPEGDDSGSRQAPIEYLLVERQACQLADQPPPALPASGFLWIDVLAGSGRDWAGTVRRLTGVEIFEEHLIDAENPAHPSFFDSTEQYEMIVMRALVARRGPRPDSPASLGHIRITTHPAVFFLLPRCLVTVRPTSSYLDSMVRERLISASRFNQRIPQHPEELALRLLSAMVDRYLDLRQPLTLQLETWQRHLLNPRRPFKDWSTLLEARMELRKLQHLSEEQLDAVQEWRDERIEHDADDSNGLRPFSDALNVRATDLVEHIQRVRSHAASLESAVESAVQLHFSATAYRTAEIMRVLTVLTAIFMPLTLITGIFGMNFDGLPGIHSKEGFWVTIGIMALIGTGMLAWFLAQRYIEAPPIAEQRRRRKRVAPLPDEAGPVAGGRRSRNRPGSDPTA